MELAEYCGISQVEKQIQEALFDEIESVTLASLKEAERVPYAFPPIPLPPDPADPAPTNDDFLFEKLPKMSDLTLGELWREWTQQVRAEGKQFPALKELERRRNEEKYKYRRPSNTALKEQVRRRRICCEYIEELGGGTSEEALQIAIQKISDEMEELKGPNWSLNMLCDQRCYALKMRRTLLSDTQIKTPDLNYWRRAGTKPF